MGDALDIAESEIGRYCRKWKITELLMFGSAARDELRPDSDLDLLVSFGPEADWSLRDHMAMTEVRQAILSSARPYYVAGRSGK